MWDCLAPQQAVDMVWRQVAERRSLQEICEFTIQQCCAPKSNAVGIGCDNITMILVAFLHGRSLEQWYDWVAAGKEKGGYVAPQEHPRIWAWGRIVPSQRDAALRGGQPDPRPQINALPSSGTQILAQFIQQPHHPTTSLTPGGVKRAAEDDAPEGHAPRTTRCERN
jgi:hypothetical protein